MQETDAPSGKQSAVDHVLIQIRNLIREQSLVVGDVLPPESELAALFGAGRNTVREAVRTLKAYGIVESRQKIGAVIVDRRAGAVADLFSFAMEISVDNFRDIQEFRRLTEMKLGENLVGKLPKKMLSELEDINERMALKTDPVQASEYDFQFHYRLVAAAENRTLVEIYTMLKPIMRRLMEIGKTRRSALNAAADEHAAIVAALRSGERIDFLYHMNRHLSAGLEFIPRRQVASLTRSARSIEPGS